MGLIILSTCIACGKKSAPELSKVEGNYTYSCIHCGSTKFEPIHRREEDKLQCHTCNHRYFFNDIGCPKCIKSSLTAVTSNKGTIGFDDFIRNIKEK